MNPSASLLALVVCAACASSSRAVVDPAPMPAPMPVLVPAAMPAPTPAPASHDDVAPRVVSPPQPDAPQEPAALRGIVEAHNARRAAHCAPPLAWSPEVAAVAQRYADQLRAGGCDLAHSSGPYGENLFGASPAGSASAAAVVEAWYGEASRYDFARPGFGMDTGHFTQVVWRASTRLGCGVARCAHAEVWVCNYDGPGNVEGRFPENVRPTNCR